MPRQTTGIISGITAALEEDKPDLRVQRLVKDPALEKMFRELIDDYGMDRRQATQAINQFARRFMSDLPERESQEVGAVDRYFNGSMDDLLRSMRSDRMRAINDAASRAVAYATRGRNASRVAGGGGGDSAYNRLLGSRVTADILSRAAVDDVEQQRRDLGATESARLGLIGRRGDIIRQRLVPYQVRAGEMARKIGTVQGINSVDPGIYNIWRKRGGMEMATDILDSLAQGAYKGANAYATFSGMGGGMGGMGGGGGGGGGGTTPARGAYGASMDNTGAMILGGGGSPSPAAAPSYSSPSYGIGGSSPSEFSAIPGYGSYGSYGGDPQSFNNWWNSSSGGF